MTSRKAKPLLYLSNNTPAGRLLLMIFFGAIAVLLSINLIGPFLMPPLDAENVTNITVYDSTKQQRMILESLDAPEDQLAINEAVEALNNAKYHNADRSDFNGDIMTRPYLVLKFKDGRKREYILHQGRQCGSTVYIDLVSVGSGTFYFRNLRSDIQMYDWLVKHNLLTAVGCG